MESTHSPRSILPTSIDSAELHKLPRDTQLPGTLRIPSRELLHRFPKLASHLQAKRILKLEASPLALTVGKMRAGKCEVQLHIDPGLTRDPSLWEELHRAIVACVAGSCPGTTITASNFTGEQNRQDGVGSFLVETHAEDDV